MTGTAEAVAALEQQIPGLKACFGGEELKRAAATLSGSLVGGGAKSPAGPTQAAEEADYTVRELVFAAKQYNATNADGKADYDSLYNHALVLTELAGKIQPGSQEQLNFLQQACDKYEAALQHRAGSQGALYNWGVALSELAHWYREKEKLLQQPTANSGAVGSETKGGSKAEQEEREKRERRQKELEAERAKARAELRAEALSCLHLASQKYAMCLEWNPHNPQALNNWGLVLQEMFAYATTPAARAQLVPCAIEKFRQLLRQRPDFDRGCYNLGTVFYACAQTMQREAASEFKGSSDALNEKLWADREAIVRSMFTIAAQYICLAYALQPHREVYRRSLSLVKTFLPLPFLRAGPLVGPATSSLGALDDAWRRHWFVLDHVSLRAASSLESSLSSAGDTRAPMRASQRALDEHPLIIPLLEITAVRRCCDPGLPPGAALWVSLEGQPAGIHLVADDEEAADAWTDALLLASHIVSTRSPEALGEALSLSAHRRTSRPG